MDEESFGQVVVAVVVALSSAASYGFLRPVRYAITDHFASTIQLILFIDYFCTMVILADGGLGSEMRTPFSPHAIGIFVLVLNVILGPCIAFFSLLFDDLGVSIYTPLFSLCTPSSIQLAPVEADAPLAAEIPAPGSVEMMSLDDDEPPSMPTPWRLTDCR